ncbi:MAG: acetate/propionate family kinase, partial [Edaphobacter sp.]
MDRGDAVHILAINSGSSSIKFSLFEAEEGDPRTLFEGEVTGIGGANAGFKFRDAEGRDLSGGRAEVKAGTSVEAIGLVVDTVSGAGLPKVEAVGYRVVHPGAKLREHVRIDDAVMKDLEGAVEFAPLHDPAAIEVIREMMGRFPDAAHYACFDTVFHQTMPETATTYAIPLVYRERGVRRYGFHGLSCESIVRQLRASDSIPFPRRMVIAHLGSGCSVTAVVDGRSVDTTMGLTPTGGVVMGTRPGDLDPGLVIYLLRQMEGDRASALEKKLNHDAGMVALSEMPNDMKAVREAVAKGDAKAKLAVEIFTRSVKKTVGGFMTLMGGVDAVVFAGGIGENDARSRAEILGGLSSLGISMNSASNEAEGGT